MNTQFMLSVVRGLRTTLATILVAGLVIGACSPAHASTSQSQILMSGSDATSGN